MDQIPSYILHVCMHLLPCTHAADPLLMYYSVSLQAFPMTTAQKRSLKRMVDSLFDVALSQTRRKITTWPPPSYSQNGKQ